MLPLGIHHETGLEELGEKAKFEFVKGTATYDLAVDIIWIDKNISCTTGKPLRKNSSQM